MSEVNQQPKPLKQQAPKIRFEGFSESWVNKIISELIQLRSETDHQDKYSIDVELENLVSNKGILIGDLTVRTQTNSIFRKGDILFGRLRPYLNKWWLADQDGVKSGEIWALYPKDQFVNTFIYACVQDQKFLNFVNQTSGTKMPRANWSSVQKESLSISLDYKEQTQIGNFFQELDKLIELQTRAIESYEAYKKAMLQKMFPQKDEKVPKVRFEGFSENWQISKLKELVISVVGNDGRQNLPILTISAAHGFMDQKDRFSRVIAGNELKKYTLLKKGELSYNRGNSKLAKFGVVYPLLSYEEALVPSIYHSFKITEASNSFFIKSLFESKLPDRELGKLVSSTARMDGMLNINSSDFMGIAIYHPSIEEQTKIGNYFQELDRNIESEKQKLEQYQMMKRAMLQRMFV